MIAHGYWDLYACKVGYAELMLSGWGEQGWQGGTWGCGDVYVTGAV